MPVRIEVSPRIYRWARERSGIAADVLTEKFKNLEAWEHGEKTPTLKQLEDFANATHTPIGYLFLDEPPVEQVPIPDYRTIGDAGVRRPSPDLLDTIFQCQQRQEWYRDFAQVTGEAPVSVVGEFTTDTSIESAADAMRTALGFGLAERGSSWSGALRALISHAEDIGVLVMVSGVVGSNTHRKLDPDEFRGFALVDSLAPLVFINGADTKAAQLFTLAHEIAHLLLGQAALDDASPASSAGTGLERWCSQVAAEFLVPLGAVADAYQPDMPLTDELERLARLFKVSTLVVLRRVHDAGFFNWTDYRVAYDRELARVVELVAERSSEGGNYYNTQPARVSRRFARAVITSTLEGQTLHRDAFRMLGLKKVSTFQDLATHLGVA